MGECMGKTHSWPCISIHSNIICRLLLKLHDEFGNLVAHYILPYKFIVRANGKSIADAVDCEAPAHDESRQQIIQPELHVPNPTPAPVLENFVHATPLPPATTRMRAEDIPYPREAEIEPLEGTGSGEARTVVGTRLLTTTS